MTKKKTFGLDIDGTVTDPATFIPYLNEHFNKNITIEDITDYDLTSLLGISSKQFWTWLQQHEGAIYKQAKIADYFLDALHHWKDNHDLIYISARGEHLMDITSSWLNQHRIPYNHIELIGSHDKINSIQQNDIDIFFEDKHDNACDIAEACDIPVILMDTPYNRKPTPSNVIRATNWKTAKEWVNHWLTTT